MPQSIIKDTLVQLKDSIVVRSFSSADMFLNHSLRPTNSSILPRETPSNFLELIIVLIGSCILVYLYISQPKRFVEIIKSFFSLSQTRQLVREDYRLNKGVSIALLSLFLLMMSYFLLLFNSKFLVINNVGISKISWYFIICLVILAVYFFKYFIHKILAALTDSREEINEYIFNVFMMNKALGLFLLPVVIVASFTHVNPQIPLYSGVFLCFLFYIIRIYRGFNIGYLSKGLSIFHLFLYLCGLEFLPFAVIIKLLVSKML